MKLEPRLLDLAAFGLAGFMAWLGWQFSQNGDWVLGTILALGSLRLIWEFTWKRRHIPTIASDRATRQQIAAYLKDALGDQPAQIIDLGAGRGELSRAIARALPKAQVTAIEWDRLPHWQSLFWQTFQSLKNISSLRRDLFTHDCHEADAVVLFLGQLTESAGEKLRRELKPGTLVISNHFALSGGWLPAETITFRTPFKGQLLIYRQT